MPCMRCRKMYIWDSRSHSYNSGAFLFECNFTGRLQGRIFLETPPFFIKIQNPISKPSLKITREKLHFTSKKRRNRNMWQRRTKTERQYLHPANIPGNKNEDIRPHFEYMIRNLFHKTEKGFQFSRSFYRRRSGVDDIPGYGRVRYYFVRPLSVCCLDIIFFWWVARDFMKSRKKLSGPLRLSRLVLRVGIPADRGLFWGRL